MKEKAQYSTLAKRVGLLNKQWHNSYAVTATVSAIFACIIFVSVYGINILDVTYVDWIKNAGGDFTQSYYGWRFFRRSSWHWPIGLMDGVASPSLTSIMYIDSVPLFNIFFKLLSPLLPATFQFFGIWGLLCFILSGALSGCIIFRFTKSSLFSSVASMFFAITPFVIQRLYTHTAFGANWIILAAILLICTSSPHRSNTARIVPWFGLLFISVSINIYYVPIVGLLAAVFCFYEIIKFRIVVKPLFTIGSALAGTAIAFYLYGGFYHLGSATLSSRSFGNLTANLNTLFNPLETNLYLSGWSRYVKTKPTVDLWQYEGYAYLGLGLIGLAVIAFSSLLGKGPIYIKDIWSLRKTEILSTSAVCLLLLILAVGPSVTLNQRVLVNIPYPQFILDLWANFRSTGRFIWAFWDILVVIVLVTIYKTFSKRIASLLVCIALILQFLDLSPMLKNRQDIYDQKQASHSSSISTSFIQKLIKNKQHIVFLTDPLSLNLYYDVADQALSADMTLNDFYYSRRDAPSIEGYAKKVKKRLLLNQAEDNTIYIFDSYSSAKTYLNNLKIYFSDGLFWGTSKAIKGLRHITSISSLPQKNYMVQDQKVTLTNQPDNSDMSSIGIQIDGSELKDLNITNSDEALSDILDNSTRSVGLLREGTTLLQFNRKISDMNLHLYRIKFS